MGDQRIDSGDLGVSGAVGFDGVDQRIELGEFARDPNVILGVYLAKQLRLERGVVRQQNIKFGFGKHRHGYTRAVASFPPPLRGRVREAGKPQTPGPWFTPTPNPSERASPVSTPQGGEDRRVVSCTLFT